MSGLGEVQNYLLRILGHGDATKHDLAEQVLFGSANINRALSTLVKRGLVHIPRWVQVRRSGGAMCWRAVFRLGAGRNRPQPRAKTNAERMRAARAIKAKRVASVFDLARTESVKLPLSSC